MARNKSEKFPRVLAERTIETPDGDRRLYLTCVHDGSGDGSADYRVAIHENKGTTWRSYVDPTSARAVYDGVPPSTDNWDRPFPAGTWTCNDTKVGIEGIPK